MIQYLKIITYRYRKDHSLTLKFSKFTRMFSKQDGNKCGKDN
jgi:hypothetical protein